MICGYVECDMWYVDMLVCDMWYVVSRYGYVIYMWYVGMWYVGMVIGIENVDVFIKFLVVRNELKDQQ